MMNINDILNQINSERETAQKEQQINKCFQKLSSIYEEMMKSDVLSNMPFKLIPPDLKYQILPYHQNGHIYFSSGSYGTFHANYYYYIHEVVQQPNSYTSSVKVRYVGPRGGDHGDFTTSFETVEEGLKEFIKKILA